MPTNRFDPRTTGYNGRKPIIALLGGVLVATLAAVAILFLPALGDLGPISKVKQEPQGRGGLTPQRISAVNAEALSPLNLRALSAEESRVYNLAIPIAPLPNPPARPFNFVGTDDDFVSAADCLTAAIYYEAKYEPIDGQRAVAQVVLNRLRHPQYPKSLCGVVFQGSQRPTGCQFTFTCDGALNRLAARQPFLQMRVLAEAALRGSVYEPVGGATHYHASYVVPYWADSLTKVKVVGQHIFYRWPGGAGLPAAFNGSHAGPEALPTALADTLARSSLGRTDNGLDEPLILPIEPSADVAMPDINTGSPADLAFAPTPVEAVASLPEPEVTSALEPPPSRSKAQEATAPSVNRRVPFSRSSW